MKYHAKILRLGVVFATEDKRTAKEQRATSRKILHKAMMEHELFTVEKYAEKKLIYSPEGVELRLIDVVFSPKAVKTPAALKRQNEFFEKHSPL